MATQIKLDTSQQVNPHTRPPRPTIGIAFNESAAGASAQALNHDGYTVMRGAFDRLSIDIYATYALLLLANGRIYPWAERHGFNDLYGDLLMESLLLHLQPAMEQTTGLRLLPTYSFLRIYETGAELPKHTDRHACELSASLTIGYDAPQPWPLWVESNGRPRSLTLAPGDMLVYRGREVPHWREEFTGRYWIQAFFHYVDAAGPLADYKYDKRAGIGVPLQ